MKSKYYFKSPVDGREFSADEWYEFDKSGVYAISDKGFKFNVNGWCLNPNQIIDIKLGSYQVEVRTFEYKGKWGNSFDLTAVNQGCGTRTGEHLCDYNSEKEAVFAALQCARKWFNGLTDQDTSSIVKRISFLINKYNPKQLELF